MSIGKWNDEASNPIEGSCEWRVPYYDLCEGAGAYDISALIVGRLFDKTTRCRGAVRQRCHERVCIGSLITDCDSVALQWVDTIDFKVLHGGG